MTLLCLFGGGANHAGSVVNAAGMTAQHAAQEQLARTAPTLLQVRLAPASCVKTRGQVTDRQPPDMGRTLPPFRPLCGVPRDPHSRQRGPIPASYVY